MLCPRVLCSLLMLTRVHVPTINETLSPFLCACGQEGLTVLQYYVQYGAQRFPHHEPSSAVHFPSEFHTIHTYTHIYVPYTVPVPVPTRQFTLPRNATVALDRRGCATITHSSTSYYNKNGSSIYLMWYLNLKGSQSKGHSLRYDTICWPALGWAILWELLTDPASE